MLICEFDVCTVVHTVYPDTAISSLIVNREKTELLNELFLIQDTRFSIMTIILVLLMFILGFICPEMSMCIL